MVQTLKRKRANLVENVPKKNRVTPDEGTDTSYEGSVADEASIDGSQEDDNISHSDDAWEGMEGIEPAPETPPTDTRLNKPPTGGELQMMKDAVDLYQSSSFKLQIDALLPNLRPNLKDSTKATLDRFLHSLRSHLMSMPSIEPRDPVGAAQALAKKGVAVPFALPHPTREVKWKVGFEPPSDINVVGSWANQICVKRKEGARFGVDLTIEMPDSLFQEKDYLDSRYFHKRSFYLAVVAQSLSGSFEVDTFYHAALGDPRLTILVLRPRKASKHDFSKAHVEIHVIPVISSSNPIPLSRLSPSHANVRLSAKPSSSASSTPIYNTNILLSTYPKLSLLSTNTIKHISPSFSDAHALLRVWANQRGYGEGPMCVRGFEGKGSWWNEVLGLVIVGEEPANTVKTGARKPLGKGLSSYQLFRAVLDVLAKQDLAQKPVFVKSSSGHKYPPEEYTLHHSVIFVDSTSTLNLLSDVPATSLDMNQSTSEFVEFGSSDNALLSAISKILRRGLGDRVKAVGIFHASSGLRPITESQSPLLSTIYIGLIYDAENAFRLVDHGPVAEEQVSDASQEFRQLWGEKAELRRFKDGRIIESVVWEVKTSDERAHIPATIVRHLLHHHFRIPINDVQTMQTHFDTRLRLPDDVSKLFHTSGSPGGFKPALAAFDGLVKSLRSLGDQIPLALSSVSPVSEYLRYTSALSPIPIPQSTSLALPEPLRYQPTIDIILEFEKSTKWPDNVRAIHKVKLAFFEAIATALMTANKGLRARVRISNCTESSIQNESSLEIQTAEGWVFSAHIWHDREAVLLERLANSARTIVRPFAPAATTPREQREARQALETYTRRFLHSPRHHRAVADLAHRYTAYAGTVRLVKRWLAAHWLLTNHISVEAVEIICAQPFVGSSTMLPGNAASVPKSKERGFALVVEFLRDRKPEDPMFVPMYEDDVLDPHPAVVAVSSKQGIWTIATSEDKNGRMWTSSGPDLIAVRRLRALAKGACKILQETDTNPLDVERLFSHATNDYDVLIELKPSVLPRYHQAIDPDPSVWSKDCATPQENNSVSAPGFDPAWLLFEDLQVNQPYYL
ncbi:hypothetical protein ID866_3669 [Astraeus odoratus]|nr:hypothetical protein ID866_3669 [Astraeus odoratus]